MPRQARLDAPGVLHHVMVRGLERRVIFRDDADRDDFLGRLGALADAGTLTVYAWALMPNHAHLLVRTGTRPLARSMRSLLTGYAGALTWEPSASCAVSGGAEFHLTGWPPRASFQLLTLNPSGIPPRR